MTDYNKYWNRRAFIGTGASALTAILAGCSSSSSDSQGQSNSKSGGSAETQLDFVGGRPPTEIQFNRWNLANFGHTYSIYWTTTLATAYADGSISSQYLEDMSADGKDLLLTFPTGWKYWNGKDLTAKDFYIQAEIDRFSDPEASPYAGHELVDKQTVKRTFKNEVTPTLMKASVVGAHQITPRWIFEDYLKRYQNAAGASERESITEELLQMTIPTKQFVEEGLGNGLYKIEQFNSAETIATKFKEHPYADRTNLKKTRIVPVGDNTGSLSKNDKLDLTSYIKERDRKIYPENLKNQSKLEWFRTQKFILNWNNEHLAKRPVRRAIISAIDLNSITATAQKYIAEPTQVQTGLRSSIHDQYLGSGFTDKLIKYPLEKDDQTATDYMKQAGYKQQNGTWTSPNGKRITLNILTRGNVGQAQPTKVLSDQLNDFGIETNVNAIGEDYYTKLQEWDFDLGWVWHVAKALWHPTAYFSNDFYGVKAGDPSRDGKGPTGVPLTVTIPKKVGAKKTQGNGVEINPSQLMTDLPASTSKEQVKKRTQTLAQWFNYDLPAIVYMQENSGYAGDVENFTFPGGDKKVDMTEQGRTAWKRGWISRTTK